MNELQLTSARPATGRFHWFVWLNCGVVAVLACAFRVWNIDSIPGINGDEAWYGIQAIQMLRGETSAWRTPMDNPLNPFYFVPQLLLHALWTPSPGLLRLPALMSGLAALAANSFLCRRLWGVGPAVFSTLLLAVLPINIAYSRFGWDASQTLLASVLVVYPALLAVAEAQNRLRWFACSLAAFGAAMLVHPSNIFLGPMALCPLYAWRKEIAERLDPRRNAWTRWLPLWAVIIALPITVAWLRQDWLAVVLQRQPSDVFGFLLNYLRLFNGTTIYRFIPGIQPVEAAALADLWRFGDALTLVIAGGAAMLLCRLVWRRREGALVSLVLGYSASTAAFFLVAGPTMIAPGWERYGIWLVAPACLLMARAAAELASRHGRLGMTLSIVLAWILLAGFQTRYFQVFRETGGLAHNTFRTAAAEPKQAALAYILSKRVRFEPTWIVTSESWNYRPLRYLALAESQVRVERLAEVQGTQGLEAALVDGRAWFVEFAGSPDCLAVRQYLIATEQRFRERTVADYGGRAILTVFEPASLEKVADSGL